MSEEDIKPLDIKGPGEVIELKCSSCKQVYTSNGPIQYCSRCQEYSFVPCIEDLNISGKQDLYHSKDMDTHYIIRSDEMKDFPAGGSRHMERSVWSCSGNVPVMSTDHCYVINERITTIGQRTSEKRLTSREDNEQQERADRADILIDNIKELQQLQQTLLNRLKEMRVTCLKDINTFRAEINNALDRLEHKTVSELEATFSEKEKELTNKLTNIQEVLDGLNNDLTNDQLDVQNKSITEILGHLQEVKSNLETDIVFTSNIKLLEFLDSLHTLGFCDFKQKQDLYQINSSQTINISHESDTEISSVHSCCFTSSCDILMSDYKNKNIKVIDGSAYTVKDVLSFQLHPLSVCEVNEKEAAVTLAETKYFGGDNRIQFISTENNKLVPTRSIKLEHCCSGIGVVDNMIYVSNERKRIYVYDVNGALNRTIYLDQTGNELFSKSHAIVESDNRKRIYITDLDKGLVTLDANGDLLWRFSGHQLQMAWAVCSDGKGNIFVSGGNSSNVVQIGSDGTYVGEIVSESNKIKDPQAICFDHKQSRLIVSQYNSNTVHIFYIV